MESAVRQLKQCHQSVVYHDKYIDKFDAISLASIDVDKPSPQQIEKVEFKSLQRLSKDVLDISSEASISLQSTIISAIALRVRDADAAYRHAIEMGAWAIQTRAG
eukprot:gene31358-40375_t